MILVKLCRERSMGKEEKTRRCAAPFLAKDMGRDIDEFRHADGALSKSRLHGAHGIPTNFIITDPLRHQPPARARTVFMLNR